MSRLLALFFMMISMNVPALAGTLEQDRASIRAMSGCYEVTFQFVETFVKDPKYPIRSKEYYATGTEWIDLDIDTDQKMALQHVLLIGEDATLKHWRQEWEYQPSSLLEYTGNDTYVTKALAAGSTQGQWAQKVGDVDDSPRYGCVAPWVQWSNQDGAQNYWECKTYAPLPRREFTQRSDYNILDRRNRHVITADGWVHEQDNRKLLMNEKGVTEIAQEKGRDTYRKIDASNCAIAQRDWNKTKNVWHVIEAMWDHIESHHPVLKFRDTVDGKVLWEKLFGLADQTMVQIESTGTFDAKALSKQSHDTIHEYLIEE